MESSSSVGTETFSTNDSFEDQFVFHLKTERFFCDFCLSEFSDERELNDHYLIHEKFSQFFCLVCKKEFTTKKSLDVHSHSHSGKERFACHVCDKTFSRKCLLEKHLPSHVKEELPTHLQSDTEEDAEIIEETKPSQYVKRHNPCPSCKRKFTKSGLKPHMRSCSEWRRKLVCSVCREVFRNRDELKHHYSLHVGDNYSLCNDCVEVFPTTEAMESHVCMHAPKKFPCEKCSSIFSSKMSLTIHMTKMHLRQVESVKCNACAREFDSLYSLEQHVETSSCIYLSN